MVRVLVPIQMEKTVPLFTLSQNMAPIVRSRIPGSLVSQLELAYRGQCQSFVHPTHCINILAISGLGRFVL